MSSGLRDLKNLGLTLQTELESQDDLIDDVDHRVQRNKLKQDRLNKQMNQLLKKKWSSKLKIILPIINTEIAILFFNSFWCSFFLAFAVQKKQTVQLISCNYLKIKKKWINLVQFCAFGNVGVCPTNNLSKKWMTLLTMILYQGIGFLQGRIFMSVQEFLGLNNLFPQHFLGLNIFSTL